MVHARTTGGDGTDGSADRREAGLRPASASSTRSIEHFTAEGLADQSLRRIAEAVGTSHRMLLYHFGSKDGLLLEVVREVEARTQGAWPAVGEDAGGETDELIRRMWAYVADPALGDFERLFFALYGRALQGDEVDPAAARRRHRALARRQRGAGRDRSGVPADVARTTPGSGWR